jgi:mono/diheme cytochrome c family protein
MRVVFSALATAAFVCAMTGGLVSGAAQTTGPRLPRLAIESMYGPDLFRMYCASCHGRDGKGGGPVAASLKVPPPDLTVLSRRQNGVFPKSEVETIITGPATVGPHGSDEMPVWGQIFRALDSSDTRANARIKNLVTYIESIQQK